MAHDVFISHATEDKAIADAVCARLEQQGIRCWIAPRDIRAGTDWGASIVRAIHEARALVLIFSASANLSHEIPREVSQAAKRGLSILTFRIEDVVPAGSLDYNLGTVHWLDAVTPPLELHIERLVDTLRSILEQPPTDALSTSFLSYRRLASLIPVFAATAAAVAFGLPVWLPTPTEFPATLAGIAMSVVFLLALSLPAMFFGGVLSLLFLRRWQEYVLTALLSGPIYLAARQIAGACDAWGMPSWGSFMVAGAFGAAAMCLVLAVWAPGFLRAIPYAAAAGALGGLCFVPNAWDEADLGGHILWQVIVGYSLAAYYGRKLNATGRPVAGNWRTLGVIAAIALLWIPVNAALDKRFEFEPRFGGKREMNRNDGLEYAWIPPGEFEMGCSPEDNDCVADEYPAHSVNIARGFWLGTSEVTAEAWRKVMKEMPSDPTFEGETLNAGWANTRMPIVNVDWRRAAEYCSAIGGRLPTEAEWEYAARAGTTTARHGRLNAIAWYANNSGNKWMNTAEISEDEFSHLLATNGAKPHQVGEHGVLATNKWNLADVLGNVAEWVADDFADQTYRNRATFLTIDPLHKTGISDRPRKIVRGGSWLDPPRHVRVTRRKAVDPNIAAIDIGFRCVWSSGPD